MRSFEERKEEIFRRSQQRIAQRKKTVKRVVLTCVPLVLCVTALTGYFALAGFGKMDLAAPESAMEPNYSLQDREEMVEADMAETPECAMPQLVAATWQQQDGEKTCTDPQQLQQLLWDLEDTADKENTYQGTSGQGEPIRITVIYDHGGQEQYTLTDSVLTGPAGSWNLTQQQLQQLQQLWSEEETP